MGRFELGHIVFKRTWIAGKIFLGAELQGVYKDGSNGEFIFLAASLHEGHMPGMQSTHGWNKADASLRRLGETPCPQFFEGAQDKHKACGLMAFPGRKGSHALGRFQNLLG